MRTFFNVISTAFLMLGAIVGAGFVSGSELVGFFNVGNFLPCTIFSGTLFFCFFALAFFLFKRFNGMENVNDMMLGGNKIFSVAVLFSAFVFFTSMLAGLDALWKEVGIMPNFPVLSLTALIAVIVSAKFGVKGLEKINLILTPAVLVLVAVLIVKSDLALKFTPSETVKVTDWLSAFLYSSMNVFLALPVLNSSARKKSLPLLLRSSAIAAVVLGVFAIIILSVVNGTNGDAKLHDMPLYAALGRGKFPVSLFFALLLGTFTSLGTSFYPLYGKAKRKYGKKGVLLVAVMAFLFSRVGLKSIVHYVYPLVGAIGVLYLVKCAWFFARLVKKRQGKIKDVKEK